MNANDPSGLRKRLSAEERKLSESDISDEDRTSIEKYVTHRKANTNNKPQSLAVNLQHLRLTAERSNVPLTEMDQEDFDRFIVRELQGNRGLSDGTVNNYKTALRPFFKWLGYPWYTDISFSRIDTSGPDPEDLFSEDEIDRLLEQGDSRGKALAALYADTGWRATAIASLQIKHLDLSGEVAVIDINEDAPVKDAKGSTPLSFSRAYVANYLRGDHPRPDNSEAALIHKQEKYEGEDGALSRNRCSQILKDMAEDAGIERDRMSIHNFRHTAVTRWRRQGIPDRIIVKRAKWVDSTQMLERYDNPTEEEELEDMAIAMGLINPGDLGAEDVGEPSDDVQQCPVCRSDVRRGARYCPGCGNPLSANAAEGVSTGDFKDPEKTAEELASYPKVLDEMGTGAILEYLVQNNPELLDGLDFD